MKTQNILEFIRGAIRPYLAFLFPTAIAVMGCAFAIKFGDREMAQLVLIFMLAEGSTILGVYFGERMSKAKKPEDKE